MKRVVSIILVYVAMALMLAGCGASKNEFDIGIKSNIEITQEDVSLSIKGETLTKSGTTMILKNNSTMGIEYGAPYEIEIKQNEEWYKINVALYFALPGYELESGEIEEIKVNWQEGYGKLAKGTYRIIKSVNYKGQFESFNVSAEFTIE